MSNQNQNTNPPNSIFKEWLEKLQQESWQLELLISGFAIYGIYESRTLLADLEFFRDNEVSGELNFIVSMLIFVFKKGWLIFFFNLIVHVILRGLWIGAIGLRYVSEEIEYDSFGYTERFTQYLKTKVGSYDDFIERLEKLCSVLFAYTFLLFLLFFSLMIFVLQTFLFAIIAQKFNETNSTFASFLGLLGTIYFLGGAIVFFDLITLGGFKRIREKSISKIYFHVYRFYSFATLSFLYRPLLYNFIDHKYTKRLFFLSIPYIMIVIFGASFFENNPNPYLPSKSTSQEHGYLIDNYNYDDLRDKMLLEFPNEERKINKNRLGAITLDQFEITKSTSSVFIKLENSYNKLLERDTTLPASKKKGISISWFNNSDLDDKNIEKLEEQKSSDIASLYEERRKINKSLKTKEDIKLRQKKDSITSKIEEKEAFWTAKFTEAERQKVSGVLNAYLSHVKLFIDSIPIPLNNCFFYTHPHYSEQGIKCMFNTDSLTIGTHIVKFEQNYLNQEEELLKDIIYLPIIKQ
ncbi:MAG TPA: hypothetical protein PKD51_02630 [Saprospiraceae bacterium]|nr:hypothetical protein [Saprospiraceae bacterium]